jgi:hypothetical protein
MLDCVIFSKDRACQLDLLLRSIELNFEEVKDVCTILYKHTNEDYKTAYNKLKQKFPLYNWVEESDFKKDLINIFRSFKHEYCMTMVDDEVVVRNYKIKPMIDIMSEYKNVLHTVSLRMQPNVNFTYTWNLHSPPPQLKSINDFIVWKWDEIDVRTDWGFPSCVNSHIYRTDFYKFYIERLQYKNVNTIEIFLHHQRQNFKPYMLCGEKSKTVCIANNVTQDGNSINSNNTEFSLETLNKKYLDGVTIKLEPFLNIEKNMATFDKEYTYEIND